MNDLNRHYQQLLGLDSSWKVEEVQLSLEAQKVEISVSYIDEKYICPECKNNSSFHDFAPERK